MANVPTQPAQTPQSVNAARRNQILMTGVPRMQKITSTSIDPTKQKQLNVQPASVGLIRGFLVKVEGTIKNDAGAAIDLTPFGASNMLTDIGFTDVNGQSRHQTKGWHLSMINSAKQPLIMGGAYNGQVPVGYGNNYDVLSAPAQIVAGGETKVQFYYYVPLAYNSVDLRGAMWAGVVNATAQLSLKINDAPVADAGDNMGLSIYEGNSGGWKADTNIDITIWQDYIDQIAMDKNGQPLLPLIDMQTLYQLQVTNMSALVANQDFGVPFANFRHFMSTALVYDNGGEYNAGTDIDRFAMQTANSSNLWDYGPEEAAFFARSIFMADPPKGAYYFDHRTRPINTQSYGATEIKVKPKVVNNGANLWVGSEYFAEASQVVFASSLPTGG